MPHTAARMAARDRDAGRYQRHRPEQTLLYRIVDEYEQREFEDYLKCGRLEHGLLQVRCKSCHAEHLAGSAANEEASVTVACDLLMISAASGPLQGQSMKWWLSELPCPVVVR